MFWSPPAALPHSPLLAPTKCDRWGGNLGDPPCPLPPPLVPPPSLSSFPSNLHTENQFEKMEASFCEEQWWIWQQLPHFLSTKLPPLFKRKRNPFLILRGGWKKAKPMTEWYPIHYFQHTSMYECVPQLSLRNAELKAPFLAPAPHPTSPFTPMKESFLIHRNSSTVEDDTTRASKL